MNDKQLRTLMFLLHRYIGSVVGLIIIVIGLTGSLLVLYPKGSGPRQLNFSLLMIFLPVDAASCLSGCLGARLAEVSAG